MRILRGISLPLCPVLRIQNSSLLGYGDIDELVDRAVLPFCNPLKGFQQRREKP
jgi:hypothetical protein